MNVLYLFVISVVHSTRPLLKDLQNIITPFYAAHWIVIGTQLEIPLGILQGIQASNPTDAFHCCNMMLVEWLDTDYNATWDKIYAAVDCPGVTKAVLNFKLNNGMFACVLVNCVDKLKFQCYLKLTKRSVLLVKLRADCKKGWESIQLS